MCPGGRKTSRILWKATPPTHPNVGMGSAIAGLGSTEFQDQRGPSPMKLIESVSPPAIASSRLRRAGAGIDGRRVGFEFSLDRIGAGFGHDRPSVVQAQGGFDHIWARFSYRC